MVAVLEAKTRTLYLHRNKSLMVGVVQWLGRQTVNLKTEVQLFSLTLSYGSIV